MITQDYIDFFKELADNNHKEWFHANKGRYEKSVKKAFLEIVEGLIPTMLDLDTEIPEDPKGIIMRINKDIRFSKDKTPYNLMMKANFTPGGRKSPNPGFYLGIGADNIHVGGGLYHATPQTLKGIRRHLIQEQTQLSTILEDTKFKKYFDGKVHGEKAKRLDVEFVDIAKSLPILYNKQFFYMAQFPTADYIDRDVVKELSPLLGSCGAIHHLLKAGVS